MTNITTTRKRILEEALEADFLVFDKASGSRWIDQDRLRAFLLSSHDQL